MIDNRTGWAAALLAVSDERGEPALCVVVEATVALDGSPCSNQPAISLEGAWDGDPACTTPREAPCATHPKAGTDCLLRGHGHARLVRFRCGPVATCARLSGPRTWVRHWYGVRPGPEGPFAPVPLTWEHATGALPANPLGTGVVARRTPFREGLALPCIEHPAQPLTRWGRKTTPIGFAATTPAWAHRRDHDAFAPQAQQVAAPDLIAPLLRGDEDITVEGCCKPIHTRLPGLPAPQVRVARRHGDLTPAARFDTVLIDADAGTIRLTWRAWSLVGEHAWVDAVELR